MSSDIRNEAGNGMRRTLSGSFSDSLMNVRSLPFTLKPSEVVALNANHFLLFGLRLRILPF